MPCSCSLCYPCLAESWKSNKLYELVEENLIIRTCIVSNTQYAKTSVNFCKEEQQPNKSMKKEIITQLIPVAQIKLHKHSMPVRHVIISITGPASKVAKFVLVTLKNFRRFEE
jgi:hypothetical protein